jgi:hypothetical protein
MAFWIWVIGFVLIIICLSLYIKAEIILEVREDEFFQGMSLQINSRFYKVDRQYDYTDPKLRLLESILVSAIEHRKSDTDQQIMSPGMQEVFRQLFKGFPVRSFFELSRANSHILKNVLRYTIVEKLEWISTVGSKDAFYTALSTGMCWTLKGILIGALSSRCSLRRLLVDVRPDFANPAFLSRFSCILKMRMVHIIIIEIYAIAKKVRWCINGFTARTTEPSH